MNLKGDLGDLDLGHVLEHDVLHGKRKGALHNDGDDWQRTHVDNIAMTGSNLARWVVLEHAKHLTTHTQRELRYMTATTRVAKQAQPNTCVCDVRTSRAVYYQPCTRRR